MTAPKDKEERDERLAFITGSRAYGTPREDSDLDLVVMLSPEDLAYLRDEWSNSNNSYGDVVVLRFGPLNLICHCDKWKYDAWRKGTELCIEKRPVTRDFAVRLISGFLGEVATRLFEIEAAAADSAPAPKE